MSFCLFLSVGLFVCLLVRFLFVCSGVRALVAACLFVCFCVFVCFCLFVCFCMFLCVRLIDCLFAC